MPGNIHHDLHQASSALSRQEESLGWITDPIYSNMPGNIYHHEDDHFRSNCGGLDL